MQKGKIFELLIEEDDELSGIDSISLVDEPAIEVNWLAFNKQKEDFIIPDGEDNKYYEMLSAIAESEEDMLNDGWVVDKVEVAGKESFTNPNATSELDTEEVRIRYKYALHPDIKENSVIPTTRDFCRNLVSKNQVWRAEDFFSLTNGQGSSAFVWRGGYNCRHVWAKITYKKTGDITNKASINKNKTMVGDFPSSMVNPEYDILGMPQPSTLTGKARDSRNPNTIRNLATRQGAYVMGKEKFTLPMFEKKEDAEDYAKLIGCEGSHEHDINGVIVYMPCQTEDMGYENSLPSYVDQVPETGKTENFESYNDYPEAAKENAKIALRWAEENGWGDCGTPVGKQRANQLANGENISEETIARMAGFARHRQNSNKELGDGCGRLMWLSWGGDEGIEWAQRKLESIRKVEMGDLSEACWPGYEAIGTKIVDGREVPNCVPKKQMSQFAADDEKRIVVGPAMVPDLNILRRDAMGNPYHVFFSADTIKMIAEKYMRNKYTDNNDTNHNGEAAKDVYVIESWIKEDENDKSTKYGFGDLPVGTWFVAMKIKNDEVWSKVKNGELNGFSVSGYFEEVASFAREEMFLKELAEYLKNVKE